MRRTLVLLVTFVSAGVLFVFPEISHAQTKNSFFAPNLNVPIPGLNFQDYPIVVKDGKATIPFFSAYVGTFFNYLTGITVVITAIMIVYGGFMYIAGSTTGQIVRGKEIIRDALIGLFLVLGSYVILFAINPDTLSLQPPELIAVKRDTLGATMLELTKTQVQTAEPEIVNASPPSAVKIETGTSTSFELTGLSDCPYTVTTKYDNIKDYNKGEPQANEFFNYIRPRLTGTYVQKIVQVAEAAQACGIILGSCNSTGGALWGLAGLQVDDSCLSKSPICTVLHYNDSTYKKNAEYIGGLPYSLVTQIQKARCTGGNTTNCATTSGAAKNMAISKVLASKMDYQAELNKIQPGDWLSVYSGNESSHGQHSLLFLGWAEGGPEKGKIISAEGPGVGKHVVIRERCISPKCGLWSPLVYILRSLVLTGGQ